MQFIVALLSEMGSSDVLSSRVVSFCMLYFKLALTECVGIVFFCLYVLNRR